MVRFSALCCLLLICSSYQVCMGNPFLVAYQVGQKAVALYDFYKDTKEYLAPQYLETSNKQLYEELKDLRSDFSNFKSEILQKMTQELKSKVKDAADTFFTHVKNIDSQYEKFLDYSTAPPGELENSTIHKFANDCVSSSLVELPNEIKKMQSAFIDRDIEGNNLISIIARNTTASDLMCVKHESKQQMINDLHQIYVMSSIKGLMVALYSYEIKAEFEHRKYKGERERAIQMFTKNSDVVADYVKSALKLSSREVWSCDPDKLIKDVTYAKLQEVFQAYVFSDADSRRLNEHNGFASIVAEGSNACDQMRDERLNCNSATCRNQPDNKRCTGHIRNCQAMSSSQICHAPDGSDRRYNWAKELKEKEEDHVYWGRKRYPQNRQCAKTQDVKVKAGVHACTCTCESREMFHDRHFSLIDVTSDVEDKNKVVTGIRLIKQFYVFQIQIEQGTLGPNGTIIDEPKWKDFKKFEFTDLASSRVAGREEDPVSGNSYQPVWVAYGPKNNVLYAVKQWRNHVYLDTLDADPKRVVTGLRFRHDEDDGLRLEIETTEFVYDTGRLIPETRSWKSNTNTRKDRFELTLNKPDDPTKVPGPNKVLSTHNQYIDFRTTDWEHDFGQYTVPFLDFQSITTTPRMPLSGAGIILKGQDGSGGFLAFKVIHYDYTNHM